MLAFRSPLRPREAPLCACLWEVEAQSNQWGHFFIVDKPYTSEEKGVLGQTGMELLYRAGGLRGWEIGELFRVGDRSVSQERRRLRDRLSDNRNAQDLLNGLLGKRNDWRIEPLIFPIRHPRCSLIRIHYFSCFSLTHPGRMRPGKIPFLEQDGNVQLMIKYPKSQNLCVYRR